MMFVLKNGVEVGVHADSIGEHLLLVVEESISTEILSEIHSFVYSGGGGGRMVSRYDAVCVASHAFPCVSTERETESVRVLGQRRHTSVVGCGLVGILFMCCGF